MYLSHKWLQSLQSNQTERRVHWRFCTLAEFVILYCSFEVTIFVVCCLRTMPPWIVGLRLIGSLKCMSGETIGSLCMGGCAPDAGSEPRR
jgi:hypothetical protein